MEAAKNVVKAATGTSNQFEQGQYVLFSRFLYRPVYLRLEAIAQLVSKKLSLSTIGISMPFNLSYCCTTFLV